MATVQTICDFLERFAPSRLAEEWDNVGLLVGDPSAAVERIMTCLTVTPASAAEAIEQRANLIISHHPLPFRSLKRLTTDTTPGRLLLELIGAEIAIYSPHTAFDSARQGINQRLALGLNLQAIAPLVAREDDPDSLGAGRIGRLPQAATVADVASRLKAFLGIDRVQAVGDAGAAARTVAVACGAAGEFLAAARRAGGDLLVLGETNFHTCLEAEAAGVALLLPGHYASERFAVECLAEEVAAEFSGLGVWPSRREADPLRWL